MNWQRFHQQKRIKTKTKQCERSLRVFGVQNIHMRKEACSCVRACWLASRLLTRVCKRDGFWALHFRSRKTTCYMGSKGRDISIRTGKPKKSAFAQAKACTRKQAFNILVVGLSDTSYFAWGQKSPPPLTQLLTGKR